MSHVKTKQRQVLGMKKKRCWAVRVRLLVLGVLIIATAMLGILRFGPVWLNRWIFIFQAYVSPGDFEALRLPSSDYTGVWRLWYRDGTLMAEAQIVSGKPHGLERNYLRDGRLSNICFYRGGRFHGPFIAILWDDGVVCRCRFLNHKLSGYWTVTPFTASAGRDESAASAGSGDIAAYFVAGKRIWRYPPATMSARRP